MKILWIEDFGSELDPLLIIIEVFSGLIPLSLDDLGKEFDPDDEDFAGQLVNVIEKHTPHELQVCNSYVQWKERCEQQAADYDVVLVDIHLESYPTPNDKRPEVIAIPEFDKRAGLYIYHQLIKRGVPDRNIAFLSGEGSLLADFVQHCDEIMLGRPKNIFEKTPPQLKLLSDWIAQKSSEEMSPTRGRLLLIDDNKDLLSDLSEKLRDHGYEVITAEDGEQASLLVRDVEFDVVITDTSGPKSGFEFLKHLHTMKPTIPVIILTGFGGYEQLKKALVFRAFDFIVKGAPWSIQSLLESVRRATWKKTIAVKDRKLRVFLCHSSENKDAVRELYRRLCNAGFDPWFDEEKLLPGQEWEEEILRAVRSTDVAIACLSRASIKKQGFIQREIKYLLDLADEQPEGTLFLIPLRLEPCEIPERLRRWHWADGFEEKDHERLLSALRLRASGLGLLKS